MGDDVKKRCKGCKVEIVRRTLPNGSKEPLAHHRRRVFCTNQCAVAYRTKDPNVHVYIGPSYAERQRAVE